MKNHFEAIIWKAEKSGGESYPAAGSLASLEMVKSVREGTENMRGRTLVIRGEQHG